MDSVTPGQLLVGQLIGFLGLVAGFVLQYLREGRAQQNQLAREARQHQWEQEDRDRAVDVLKLSALKTAKELAAHTTETAVTLAQQTAATSKRLEGQIAENTAISRDAFHEANSVNLKIASLGIEHNRLLADTVAAAADPETLRRIEHNTAATAVNTTPLKPDP